MKRSSAITEIYHILAEFYEAARNGKRLTEERDNEMGTREWAEGILYRLEAVGMLPPMKHENLVKGSGRKVGEQIAFRWEEEDEKK